MTWFERSCGSGFGGLVRGRSLAVALGVCLVGACQGEAPQDMVPVGPGPSASDPNTGSERAGIVGGQESAAEVLFVSEFDPALREGATWTTRACALTTEAGDELVVREGRVGFFDGYFIDPGNAPAGDFDFVLRAEDGRTFRIAARTGSLRPDVAEFFDEPSLERAGYRFSASLAGLPAGRYAVEFMLERSGVHYFCESGKYLIVR